MTEMDERAAIRQFIIEDLLFGAQSNQLDDDTSLTASGVLDSTGVIELVTFIESHFGVHVADEELLPENLDSVSRITVFVLHKRGSSGD